MSTSLGSFRDGLHGAVDVSRFAAGSARGGGCAFQLSSGEAILQMRLETLGRIFKAACELEDTTPAAVLDGLKDETGETES